MKKIDFFLLVILILTWLITFCLVGVLILGKKETTKSATKSFQIKSVDTMKYSRDFAREKKDSETFKKEVEVQVKNIADLGANYIAIATPYDDEFLPYLRLWVSEARENNLKVWFRGNWSSWEGWFNYPKGMSFEEHINKSRDFILANPDLFENGDSFTACPECENGAAGDPRYNGKLTEYRGFLVRETIETQNAFQSIGKKVNTNWLSMNRDVAEFVMDKDTTASLGGVVVIDHYTKDPAQMRVDADNLSAKSGGKIIFGELGAPIQNITGKMNEDEQAVWLEGALSELSKSENVLGVNYWVNRGGETEIFRKNNSPKKAARILTEYFKGN